MKSAALEDTAFAYALSKMVCSQAIKILKKNFFLIIYFAQRFPEVILIAFTFFKNKVGM